MAKAKEKPPWVRYFLIFACRHCGSERRFVYTEAQATDATEAERLARRQGNLAPELWELKLAERRED